MKLKTQKVDLVGATERLCNEENRVRIGNYS